MKMSLRAQMMLLARATMRVVCLIALYDILMSNTIAAPYFVFSPRPLPRLILDVVLPPPDAIAATLYVMIAAAMLLLSVVGGHDFTLILFFAIISRLFAAMRYHYRPVDHPSPMLSAITREPRLLFFAARHFFTLLVSPRGFCRQSVNRAAAPLEIYNAHAAALRALCCSL